jgi:hypothetical protein
VPNPAWDNLDDFLSLQDFALQAQFTSAATPPAYAPFTCNVIFDEPFMDAKLGEYVMDAMEPRCTCKQSDVANVKKYDTVVIAGISLYLTHDPLPDGVGMAVVKMARDLGEVPGVA